MHARASAAFGERSVPGECVWPRARLPGIIAPAVAPETTESLAKSCEPIAILEAKFLSTPVGSASSLSFSPSDRRVDGRATTCPRRSSATHSRPQPANGAVMIVARHRDRVMLGCT